MFGFYPVWCSSKAYEDNCEFADEGFWNGRSAEGVGISILHGGSSLGKMEHIEAVSEREWISLSGIYTAEEVDFMSQLLGNFVNQTSIIGIDPEAFWPGGNYEGSRYCLLI